MAHLLQTGIESVSSLAGENPAQQPRDQSRSPGQFRRIDVFADRMRSAPDGTEPVKCWDAGGGRKVSVRATTRATFAKRSPQLGGHRLRLAE